MCIRGGGRIDSLLTFLSACVLTVTPGKVGEVLKSLLLFETHGVAVARTAPIVIAERVTGRRSERGRIVPMAVPVAEEPA